MAYTIKFNTTIEWEITDKDQELFAECSTPEAFIAYQTTLLKPTQSLQDFIAMGEIKRGDWAVYTEDAVEDMGEWKGGK
jgi:hypothetical protein